MWMANENHHWDQANRRPQLLVVQVSLISVATLVVALRLFTRYVIIKSPGADDYAIVVALVRPPSVLLMAFADC